MSKIQSKAFPSAHVVLLAFNWEEGKSKNNFAGFAIKRKPGFYGKPESWLENRLNFKGPVKTDDYKGSDKNPIQKFFWWDAQINDDDEVKTFSYTIIPALYDATKKEPVQLVNNDAVDIPVSIPSHKTSDGKISSYFNRAVVSSQSFSHRFVKDGKFIESKRKEAYEWLSNGLSDAIGDIVKDAENIEGAVYHLKDDEWIIPAMKNFNGNISMVLDYHIYAKNTKDGKHKKGEIKDVTNEDAKKALKNGSNNSVVFSNRTRTNIMHNKFLVNMKNDKADRLLMGSANFTTGALTSQANLLHIYESPELAQIYLERKKLLEGDPTRGKTAENAGWTKQVRIGNAKVRAFFSPEKDKGRIGLDPVLKAIQGAKRSDIFCIFTPTDKIIRDAIFEKAGEGKMMFGLVNSISAKEPAATNGNTGRADFQAKIEIYTRSKENKDVYAHKAFDRKNTPNGFWTEISGIGKIVQLDDDGDGTAGAKKGGVPEVFIHHKFIVIDAETDNPTIYTGSANFSGNSSYNNDENLLEIKGAPEVAKMYLCEFIRLYEHYRARSRYQEYSTAKQKIKKGIAPTEKQKRVLRTFKLAQNADWAKDDFTKDTPAYRARLNLVK